MTEKKLDEITTKIVEVIEDGQKILLLTEQLVGRITMSSLGNHYPNHIRKAVRNEEA